MTRVREVGVWFAIVVFGLAVGVLTLAAERALRGSSLAVLVNSVSPWLVAPFAVGALVVTRARALTGGLVVCLMQVVGYYAAIAAQGFVVHDRVIVFWTLCALVGGPLLGAAGSMWRTGGRGPRGLGMALLAGAFIAEGLWVYGLERGAHRVALMYVTIGALLALGLSRTWLERCWLAVVVPVGIGAEMLLGLVYSHSF